MKKSEHVRTEFMIVTPEMASAWLEKNIEKNRKLKERLENKYLAAMTRGRWNERSGETVKFDEDGNMIDGQHRLRALIRYGKPLWFSVSYNCARDAFKNLDTGATRKGPDVLSIDLEDGKNLNILSSVLTLIHRAGAGFNQTTYSPSNDMILELAERHPGAQESVAFVLKHRTPKGFMSPSMIAFMHYQITRKHSRQMADNYVLAILDGETCKGDQPLKLMRRRLIDNLASPHKMRRLTMLALLVKSWNAFATGTTLKAAGLRWRGYEIRDENGKSTNKAVEAFPKMV